MPVMEPPLSPLSVNQGAGAGDSSLGVLSGNKPIRRHRSSRPNSHGPRRRPPPEPLLEFLDEILRFSKHLLREDEPIPLRDFGHRGTAAASCSDSSPEGASRLAPRAQTPSSSSSSSSEPGAMDLYSDMPGAAALPGGLRDDKWKATCAAVKTELNRLVMWKFDVAQKRLGPALRERSPLYSVLCESILGIAEVVKSLPSDHFITSLPDGELARLYTRLDKAVERFKHKPDGRAAAVDEEDVADQPSTNTRSLTSVIVVETFEVDVLAALRSDVSRLVHMVDVMVSYCKKIRAKTDS